MKKPTADEHRELEQLQRELMAADTPYGMIAALVGIQRVRTTRALRREQLGQDSGRHAYQESKLLMQMVRELPRAPKKPLPTNSISTGGSASPGKLGPVSSILNQVLGPDREKKPKKAKQPKNPPVPPKPPTFNAPGAER